MVSTPILVVETLSYILLTKRLESASILYQVHNIINFFASKVSMNPLTIKPPIMINTEKKIKKKVTWCV